MIYGRAAPFPRIYQAFTGVSVPASWFCTPDHSLLPPGFSSRPRAKTRSGHFVDQPASDGEKNAD